MMVLHLNSLNFKLLNEAKCYAHIYNYFTPNDMNKQKIPKLTTAVWNKMQNIFFSIKKKNSYIIIIGTFKLLKRFFFMDHVTIECCASGIV